LDAIRVPKVKLVNVLHTEEVIDVLNQIVNPAPKAKLTNV
jgi:hypothetical protein